MLASVSPDGWETAQTAVRRGKGRGVLTAFLGGKLATEWRGTGDAAGRLRAQSDQPLKSTDSGLESDS